MGGGSAFALVRPPPPPPPLFSSLFSSFHSVPTPLRTASASAKVPLYRIPFGQRFYSFFALTLSGDRRVTFVVLARVESSFSDEDGDAAAAAVPAIN